MARRGVGRIRVRRWNGAGIEIKGGGERDRRGNVPACRRRRERQNHRFRCLKKGGFG